MWYNKLNIIYKKLWGAIMKFKQYMKMHFPNVPLMLADTAVCCLALFLGVCLGCDFNFSLISHTMFHFVLALPFLIVTVILFFYSMGIYKIIWHYTSINDIVKTTFTTIFPYIFLLLFQEVSYKVIVSSYANAIPLPYSSYLTAIPIAILFVLGIRFFIRSNHSNHFQNNHEHPVLIFGAGDGGAYLCRILQQHPDTQYKIIGFMDDDPQKIGRKIYGLPILGDRYAVTHIAKHYNVRSIFFSIPSCPSKDKTEILNICAHTGCDLKIVPSVEELIESQMTVADFRNVDINDLLGRDPIRIDMSALSGYIQGKTILLTGAGGSIGSELCRQLANHDPKKLILFDIYENSTYEILQELKRMHKNLDIIAIIGSMCDEPLLDKLFNQHKPDIVYHAAAHKHVPLMEDSPCESVKNNVFGTLRLVRMADKHNVSRFVLISTDKAVNPTNIMGATKRICEMIIQTYNNKSKTEFVAVRFGNVLGSNGSVIPLFKQQIASGGPVTVTHPDIIRYFMTIPEAVSLVLQAGMNANGGEIFVLDMGKPVRILHLAENLIRLSGYEPYKDIDIVFTGLRPGEKLYEELLMDEEGLKSTANKLIFIGNPIEIQEDLLFNQLQELEEAAERQDTQIRSYVQKIVPTYHPKI